MAISISYRRNFYCKGQAVAGAIVGICLICVVMGALVLNFLGAKKVENMQAGKSSTLLLSGSVEAVALGHAQKVIALKGSKGVEAPGSASYDSLPELVAALNKLSDWAPGPWQWGMAVKTPNQNFTLDPFAEPTTLSYTSSAAVGALASGGKFGKLSIPVRITATLEDGTQESIERVLSYYISNPAAHALMVTDAQSLTRSGVTGPATAWVNKLIPRNTTKVGMAENLYAYFGYQGSMVTASPMLTTPGVQYQESYAGLSNVIVVDVATMPQVLTVTAGSINKVVVKGNPADAVQAPKVFLTNCETVILHGNNVTPLVMILPASHSGQVNVLSPAVLPTATSITTGQPAGLMNWRGVLLWEGSNGMFIPLGAWGEVWATPLAFNGSMIIRGSGGASLTAANMLVNLAGDPMLVTATDSLVTNTRFRLIQATLE